MKLRPTTDRTACTPSIGRTTLSTWATNSSVRLIEAPSGRRMAAKKTPWSSDGRKPCGVTLNRKSDAAPAPATTTTPITADPHQAARRRNT